ncbi:Urm1-domain-containing protein [Cutaneotrichosporon oleaginosum]|uniref:Ubiquitin-related modifier 1 n=1 Tax=Cutaneotrichosporon oleaginosum TaxID=879819 RepID=A0A0J1AUM8_9TREE|nr:Urm1-domain-containing protein [Cutaneotrichosporon oleaginosum]KLT38984.1 Urm1-domain-containing protein [Cutaneotrichosporon oleaginosum]TXT14662.1 hypothetical protein COLE_00855 [Cutaneotrichosporon oleaginosum]
MAAAAATAATALGTSNGLGYAAGTTARGAAATRTKGVDDLTIKLEFGGGLHLLFSAQPRHVVHVPRTNEGRPADIRFLIQWMTKNLVSEREDMFIDGESVRPGILVLINDADWELEGELDYELQDGDEIVFISTLHGG